MKKLILCFSMLAVVFTVKSQVVAPCNLTGKPWIVLNGQMVNNVYPNTAGSALSDYVLSVPTNNPASITVIKTEEMEILTRTQTINGLSRWFVRYKTNRARTIFTAVINCPNGIAQVYELERPVKLFDTLAVICPQVNRLNNSTGTVFSNDQVLENDSDGITVFPNPANTFIQVNYKGTQKTAIASIYDNSGKMIMQSSIINANINKLDIATLPVGYYSLQVSDGVAVYNSKFIKN
jgi:hypothetical protein